MKKDRDFINSLRDILGQGKEQQRIKQEQELDQKRRKTLEQEQAQRELDKLTSEHLRPILKELEDAVEEEDSVYYQHYSLDTDPMESEMGLVWHRGTR
jgi:hypothetical protein